MKRGVSRPYTERIISLRKASLLFFVVQINIIIIRSDLYVFFNFTYVHQIEVFNILQCEIYTNIIT